MEYSLTLVEAPLRALRTGRFFCRRAGPPATRHWAQELKNSIENLLTLRRLCFFVISSYCSSIDYVLLFNSFFFQLFFSLSFSLFTLLVCYLPTLSHFDIDIDIDTDIFVNCSWVDTRWQYTFTHKQYIEHHN
jgi:hypothetical protein